VLKDVVREKVVRILLATLNNLLDDSTAAGANSHGSNSANNVANGASGTDDDPLVPRSRQSLSKAMCEEAVGAGLRDRLDMLQARKFKDDDVPDIIEAIRARLEEAVLALTSFDRYVQEVSSRTLEWTPVHSSQFFRENMRRFEEKSFGLIRQVIALVTDAKSTELTVAVGCRDLGEFARFHPDGRRILQQYGGKKALMEKLSHKSPHIAREALLAVQKLMVTNWESISRVAPSASPSTSQRPVASSSGGGSNSANSSASEKK